MRLKRETVKSLLFRVATTGVLNRVARLIIKPLAPLLPARLVTRIPVVGRIRLRLPGGATLILINDGTDQIASKLYWGGIDCYEPGTIRVYADLLRSARVVFDVGANTGLFALLAAIGDRERQVHAFEPLGRVFACLVENIRANGLTNIQPVQSVVTDLDGTVPFYEPLTITLPSSGSALSGFVPDRTREVTLPAVTIDSYVSEAGISRLDLLKIDVEGGEDRVIRGALRTILRDRPALICEVLAGFPGEKLEALLAPLGYRFMRISDKGLVLTHHIVGGQTEHDWNFLFVTSDRLARLSVPVSPGPRER